MKVVGCEASFSELATSVGAWQTSRAGEHRVFVGLGGRAGGTPTGMVRVTCWWSRSQSGSLETVSLNFKPNRSSLGQPLHGQLY